MDNNNALIPGFDNDKDDSLTISLRKAEGVPHGMFIYLSGYIDTYNSSFFQKQIQKIIKAKGYKSIEDFVGNDQFRFICDGIGDVLSVKLHNGIQLNIDDMRKTLNYVTLIEEEKTEGKLSGLSFCFTGAMEYKRSDLQKMVKDNGGENFDSVKKGLSYLVMQDLNSTSGKAKKAREQGTNLITVEQFLSMID
jgi:NAD-dependent DNA ligase